MTHITNDPKTMGGLSSAAGKIKYGLTNDYMFRAVLQSNNVVLKNLISALLHLKEEEITSVILQNPIELGKSIRGKDFQLDIVVLLNNDAVINLEMQVINKGNWTERSLSYLCRTYDGLERGQDYTDVKTAIHIGFLDFTLPGLTPEFYASYYLMNEKNYERYSDKLRLSIVNLRQIELATEEDKAYHIDEWAALFKAETWEEIKMLAEKNSLLYEASKAFYELSEDEKIRQQCEARLDYERTHAHFYRAIEENKELDKMLKEKTLQLQKLSKQMQKNERQIQQREALIQQQAEALLKKEEENAVLKAQLEKITKEKDFDKKSDET